MKTSLLAVVFLLFSINTYSQNIIDPPLLPYNFNDTTIFDRNFNSNKFILGWNWGSPGRALDEALRINFYHDGYFPQSTTQEGYTGSANYIPNHNKVAQVSGVSGGRLHNVILNAHSLMLYPVLNVDSSSNFVPRKYDSSGAVFGFMNKNKVRILDSMHFFNKDYQFALLDKDSITTGPEVVLSDIWKGDVLLFLNYEGAV